MASTDRFGYEWNKYAEINPAYEGQLRNWISPLTPEFFRGKHILDAGCGMGRNSYWIFKWGAKQICAFDFDDRSVNAAQKNLQGFANAEVSFKSVYDIDWHEKFDAVICIGVLHHLTDPQKAIRNLYKTLKPSGTLIAWVYSCEGNEWIVKYINPIRKHITSKLPIAILHVLSSIITFPLMVFVKIFHGPTKYLKQLSSFSFRHVNSIVFDQLLPRVANYWHKEEVIKLFSGLNAQSVSVHRPPNEQGWTIIVEK